MLGLVREGSYTPKGPRESVGMCEEKLAEFPRDWI